MRRLLPLTTLALLAAAPIPARAAVHVDPTGDTCKTYRDVGERCGRDILSVEDAVAGNGAVTITITQAATTDPGCFSSGVPGIQLGAATGTAATHRIEQAPGAGAWHLVTRQGVHVGDVVAASAATTTTITFDPALLGSPAAIRYLVGDYCFGEEPHESPDRAPDLTALPEGDAFDEYYVVTLASGPTRAQLAQAARSGLGTGSRAAATLLATGALPITLTLPAAARVVATLAAPAGAGRSARARVVVVAKATRTVGAGRRSLRLALTAAGRKLLRDATRRFDATLKIAVSANGVTGTASRRVPIRPRPARQ